MIANRQVFAGATVGFVLATMLTYIVQPVLLARIGDAAGARDIDAMTFWRTIAMYCGSVLAALVLWGLALALRSVVAIRAAALVMSGYVAAELLLFLNERFSVVLLLRAGRILPGSYTFAHMITRLAAPILVLLVLSAWMWIARKPVIKGT